MRSALISPGLPEDSLIFIAETDGLGCNAEAAIAVAVIVRKSRRLMLLIATWLGPIVLWKLRDEPFVTFFKSNCRVRRPALHAHLRVLSQQVVQLTPSCQLNNLLRLDSNAALPRVWLDTVP